MGSSDGLGVREMLDALVRDGALSRHANVQEASGKAQVRPKSSEKCAFILNCVKLNACDGRKPRDFQLPRIEHLRDSILLGGRHKLNMANCTYPTIFGVCACHDHGLVSSVCAWVMPNMYGNPRLSVGSIRPSCVRSWYTVWSGPRSGGCLCWFFSTWTGIGCSGWVL